MCVCPGMSAFPNTLWTHPRHFSGRRANDDGRRGARRRGTAADIAGVPPSSRPSSRANRGAAFRPSIPPSSSARSWEGGGRFPHFSRGRPCGPLGRRDGSAAAPPGSGGDAASAVSWPRARGERGGRRGGRGATRRPGGRGSAPRGGPPAAERPPPPRRPPRRASAPRGGGRGRRREGAAPRVGGSTDGAVGEGGRGGEGNPCAGPRLPRRKAPAQDPSGGRRVGGGQAGFVVHRSRGVPPSISSGAIRSLLTCQWWYAVAVVAGCGSPWKVVAKDIPVDGVPDCINRPNYGFAKGTGTDDVGIRLIWAYFGLMGIPGLLDLSERNDQ